MAQSKWKLDIDGKVEENGKKLEAASVKIFKNGTEAASLFTSSAGAFKYSLEPNADYLIKITKAGGYVTKIISISTKNVPNTEDERDFMPFKMEVTLFKEAPGLDVSVLKEPIGKIFYVQSKNNFDYDEAYTKAIRAQLAQLQMDLEKEMEAQAKRKAEFDKLIQQGDAAVTGKKFDNAITSFTEALALKVDDEKAKAKLEAAQKAKEAEEGKNKKAEFDKLIKQGDEKMPAKKFDEAITSYNQALALKVDDATANAKIKAAQDAKKAEEEANKNKEEQAKKKAEFDALIKQGDGQLKDKKFDEAVATYNQALKLNVDNPTANAKIAEAQKAKADEEANKSKEEAAKKKAEFDKLIKQGDDVLKGKKFDEAVAAYNQALAMKVDDATANARIAAAQKAKADEEALKNKEEAEKKRAEFDKVIKQGDELVKAKKFDEAVGIYTQALNMKVDDAAANAKIAEAQKAKADAEAAKNKEEFEKKKAEFDKNIKQGDEKLAAKKFDEAIGFYNTALALKVDDPAANAKIKTAQDAKKAEEDAQKSKEELEKKKAEFDALMKQGDGLLKEKKFDEAVGVFTQALNLNVNNDVANAKIAEAQKAKAAAEEEKNKAEAEKRKAEFAALIKQGDGLLKEKKFDEAVGIYTQALNMKIDDAAANAKIAEAQKAKADDEAAKNKEEAEKKRAEFDKTIKQGDDLLKSKKFDEAVGNYTQALNMKVDDAAANAKIAEAQKAKADDEAAKNKEEAEKKRAEFDKVIKQGDDLLKDKKFDEAVGVYTQALNMKVDDAAANAKIAEATKAKADFEAEKNKAENEKKKAEFEKLLKQGDEKLASKKFDDAITAFNAALALQFDDATANARIKAAQDAKKAEEDAAKSKEELEKKKAEFEALMKQGDGLLKEKKFDEAVGVYTQALNLGVNNDLANSKIAEAQKAKAAAEEEKNKAESEKRKAEFEAFIKQGDGLLKDKKFDDAVAVYTQALNMNLNNETANAKIAEAQKAKADDEAAKNKEEADKKRSEFEKIIKQGDDLLKDKKFDEAVGVYTQALNMKVDDAAANAKIAEATKAKADFEAEKNKAENEKKKAEFEKLLKQGDEKLSDKKFDDAITAFNAALALQFDDATANARIKTAQDAKKAEEDAAKSKEEEAKRKSEFEAAIKQGDAMLKEKKYDESIASYNQALSLNFNNDLANTKIAEAQKAKADAEAAKNKEEAEKKRAEFEKAIKLGDDLLKDKKFDEAIAAYNQALSMQVDDAQANAKIAEAQKAKADFEAAKNKEESERKRAEFDKLIKQGDEKLGSKKFDEAIAAFTQALNLQVDDAAANSKIQAAKDAKQAEEDAAKNKAEAEKRKADFESFLKQGDQNLKDKKFDDAIGFYTQALNLNHDNNLANTKIGEAQKAKADDDAAKSKAEADKLKSEFNALIDAGDKLIKQENFDGALEKFNAALGLKVDDNLANQKIADLEKKRADYLAKKKAEEDARNKADLEKREKEFKKLIASGDNDLSFKKYDNAGLFYSQALELNVDNPLAEKKMDDLRKARAAEEERLKAEMEAKEKAEREAREKAEAERKKREFERLMVSGKGFMGVRDFNSAIDAFQSALDLGVDNAAADIALKDAKRAKEAADLEKRKKQFGVLIGEGTSFHKLKSYQLAIDKFQAALDLNIDNPKASELLDKSQKALDAQRAAEERRKAAMDDVARKKAEAEAREREFLEKKRRAEEAAKTALIARLEEQKNALAQAQRFQEQNKQKKTDEAQQKSGEETLSRAELAKKYAQGITTEEIDGPNCTITRVVVVNGELGDEYKKTKYNWGQIYFTKNGKQISETIFNASTKGK